MANLSKTRALFAFTSPRTIEKIIPEIAILVEKFAGQSFNTANQEAFFDQLYASEFYASRTPPKNKALAARDRITRSPKAFGFVDLNPTIQLTQAGQRLLSGNRIHETFTKQFLKFQFPSFYHRIPAARGFNVRPYLELLRLIRTLGSVSKSEIAMFFTQLTNYNDFDAVVGLIQQYRADVASTAINRDVLKEQVFERELRKIYAADIAAGNFKTRESPEVSLSKFLKTKRSNHNDNADAFTRCMRTTQLVTFQRDTFRLILNPDRVDEVEYILDTVPRDAIEFHTMADFKVYLFNPDAIRLLTDDPVYLGARLQRLNVQPPAELDIEALKDFVEEAEAQRTEEVIHQAEEELKEYQEFEDVMDIFQKISTKDIPAPALFLEWNVWRGLVMLNDAQRIQGNFRLDLDGVPLSPAPGNQADIEADYDGFKLIVEVTTSTGQTQFNMESESVPRHFGNLQRGSNIPVYCIFVAPSISSGALAYFFNLNRIPTAYYGGKTRIVPMTVTQYMQFLTIARKNGLSDSRQLKAFLDAIIDHNQNVASENEWLQFVNDRIPTWADA